MHGKGKDSEWVLETHTIYTCRSPCNFNSIKLNTQRSYVSVLSMRSVKLRFQFFQCWLSSIAGFAIFSRWSCWFAALRLDCWVLQWGKDISGWYKLKLFIAFSHIVAEINNQNITFLWLGEHWSSDMPMPNSSVFYFNRIQELVRAAAAALQVFLQC